MGGRAEATLPEATPHLHTARAAVRPAPFGSTPQQSSAPTLIVRDEQAAPLAAKQAYGEPRDLGPQSAWAARTVAARLDIVARARALIAEAPHRLVEAISPDLTRTPADTLAAEVLPLLAAFRFIEREAAHILRPRRLGRAGRPFWLPGVSHRIERVPLGRVLVIAPGNYPLFLPGVQILQALVAGNSVIWKPGRRGEPVARALAAILTEAGLPAGLLHVTAESAQSAEEAIADGVDKIFLTGSAETGRKVLTRAAASLTPVVAELSGCDSVVVLPDADLNRVTKALAFGMRLNGSATCMAPRRLLLVDSSPDRRRELIERLLAAFSRVPITRLAAPVQQQLRELLDDAVRSGATIHAELSEAQRPILVAGGQPSMRLAHTDLFAPVLTLINVPGDAGVLAAESASPFALTCSIFGSPRRAHALARRLRCGTVLINDLIAPTADPRVPFGGFRGSGFGVTRGAEGLLEMTAVRVITTRRGRGTRHFEPTSTAHEGLFRAFSRAGYAQTWHSRFAGARAAFRALRGLGDQK